MQIDRYEAVYFCDEYFCRVQCAKNAKKCIFKILQTYQNLTKLIKYYIIFINNTSIETDLIERANIFYTEFMNILFMNIL